MAEVAVYRPGKHELQQINQTHLQQNSPFLYAGLFLCEAAKTNKSQARVVCGRVINSAVYPPENATLPIFARLERFLPPEQSPQGKNEGGAGNTPAAPGQLSEMLVPVRSRAK
jgi:hypothetical protein